MKKLTNSEQDRNQLYNLIKNGERPRAFFELGCFTSELVSSFTTVKYEGVITDIDIESGYCEWENLQGNIMPSVNINIITLYTE